ncbi:MAG TPA: hypothetical protein VLN57_20720, partial [Xanthobacteraceae bacterium]|nr:hypothetical protein [Xanthobacteraceae bacterium]
SPKIPRTVCSENQGTDTYPKAAGFASLLVPSIFDAKFRPSRNVRAPADDDQRFRLIATSHSN